MRHEVLHKPRGVEFLRSSTAHTRYGKDIIGLPSYPVMVVTNSERGDSTCQRRWWYGNSVGINNERTNDALRFGSEIHELLELIYLYYNKHNKKMDQRYLDSFLENSFKKWDESYFSGNTECYGLSTEDIEKEKTRIKRAINGYIRKYDSELANMKIIGVETPIAAPIIDPYTKKVFQSTVPVIWDERLGVYRIATHTDNKKLIVKRRLKWYQICKLDAIAEADGKLWVVEHKTTSMPKNFTEKLYLDTQLPGYVRALRAVSDAGLLGPEKLEVGGYIYDVISSQSQNEPKILKSGKLSLAKNQRIPSWLFKKKVKEYGFEMSDPKILEFYLDLVDRVDPYLYMREWGYVSRHDTNMYSMELFAVAGKLAENRKNQINLRTIYDVALNFPRNPVCRKPGGFCAYSQICSADTMDFEKETINHRVAWIPKIKE